ncbi:uncharacterized protein LOC111243929 isoform X2 [Varroa destructor]|uniref:Uncharacterized protein n=1 Tax=Varroa destructor TaxID=109461 RepID=A0A7M7J2J8_VARDE|nr:uncharacterized protein LOC111243929 isoform X2 [Varroa destructor]
MPFEADERSLAQDRELIHRLAQKSDELLSRLAEVTPSLEQLTTETAKVNLIFRNVIGDLNALSEKRFVENRVEAVHERKIPPEPKGPRPATAEELREAVQEGLQSFGLLPAGELTDMETGYECFQRERPFSLVIGTPRWLEEDPLGRAEVPETSGTFEESLLSEAIEDLISPISLPYEIEKAADAAEWFDRSRQGRTSSISTPTTFAEDSSSLSSVFDFPQRSSVPTILPQPGNSKDTASPGGPFDDESENDGDLFGTVQKPSLTYCEVSQQKKSARQATKVTSLLDKQEPLEAASIVSAQSFLSELKFKTTQRTKQSTDAEEEQRRSIKHTSEKSQPTAFAQVSDDRKRDVSNEITRDHNQGTTAPPTLFRNCEATTKTALAQKRPSIFDSDSDSDLLAPVAPPPSSLNLSKTTAVENPLSQTKNKSNLTLDSDQESEKEITPSLLHPSMPTLSNSGNEHRNSIIYRKDLPKRGFLFDSGSDSESDIFSKKPSPLFKKNKNIAASPHSVEPAVKAKTTSIEKEQVRKNALLPAIPFQPTTDKDRSDEKIFGSRFSAPDANLQPPQFTPLSLDPIGATITEKKTIAELQSREHIPKPLESFVKPPSSDSDESAIRKHSPEVDNIQDTDHQKVASKKLALFDSESDDDSLFGDPLKKPTAYEEKLPRIESYSKSTLGTDQHLFVNSTVRSTLEKQIKPATETVVENKKDEKSDQKQEESNLKMTYEKECVNKISAALPIDTVESVRQKQQQSGTVPVDGDTQSGNSYSERSRQTLPDDESPSNKMEKQFTEQLTFDEVMLPIAAVSTTPIADELKQPIASEDKSLVADQAKLPAPEQGNSSLWKIPVKSCIPVKIKPPFPVKVNTTSKNIIKTPAENEAGLSQETQPYSRQEVEHIAVEKIVRDDTSSNETTMDQDISSKKTGKIDSVKRVGTGLPVGLLRGLKLKQQQFGIAPPQRKTHSSDSDCDSRSESESVDSSIAKPESALFSGGQTIGKVVENKGIINITKSRAKGPIGRRLPSRTKTCTSQENTDQVTDESGNSEESKSEIMDVDTEKTDTSVTDGGTLKASLGSQADVYRVITPSMDKNSDIFIIKRNEKLTKENSLQSEDIKTDIPTPEQKPALVSNTESNRPTRCLAEESPKLFSSDSDDELFAPQTIPQKKTLPREAVTTVTKTLTTSKDVPPSKSFTDPLSVLPAGDTEVSAEKNKQSVAAGNFAAATKISSAPSDKKRLIKRQNIASLRKANIPSRNELFEDSGDDDEDLFGTKKDFKTLTQTVPKSLTSLCLPQNFGQATTPQSQLNSKGLFGSDSDSDDLFRK